MKTFFSCILMFCMYSTCLYAQDVETSVEVETESESEFKHHQIGIILGHAHISQGHVESGKKWLAIPMISLNYNYKINERWGIGLHTDFNLESFQVESYDENIVERETPIAPAVMVLFKPGEHFTYMLGAGEEFSKEEDLFLIRAEAEYGLELPKSFEFSASIGWDFRFDAYDSWALAVGVSKLF